MNQKDHKTNNQTGKHDEKQQEINIRVMTRRAASM